MKTCKKLLIIGMALSLLLTLCACSSGNQSDDKKDTTKTNSSAVASQPETTTTTTVASNTDSDNLIDYQVKVLDGQGSPMTSGIVVKFLKNGEQVAMQKTDANGVATKKLEKGDYTIELMFTDSSLTGDADTNSGADCCDAHSQSCTKLS